VVSTLIRRSASDRLLGEKPTDKTDTEVIIQAVCR
jgi:hypothetical protein